MDVVRIIRRGNPQSYDELYSILPVLRIVTPQE
ncbi:hypothetical protein 7t3_0142 [Salmonella phage 7t3]|nr:hypothetical protein 7t3_0142 [Salmonella phage 7t3]